MYRRDFLRGVVAVTSIGLSGCTEDDDVEIPEQDAGAKALDSSENDTIRGTDTTDEEEHANQENTTTQGSQRDSRSLSYGETFRTHLGVEVTVSNPRFEPYIRSERGRTFEPDPGNKILYIHIKAENTNTDEAYLPFAYAYLCRINNSQYESTWGTVVPNRYDGGEVLGGIVREGDLAYEVPEDAQLEDVQIVLTEDVEASVSWS